MSTNDNPPIDGSINASVNDVSEVVNVSSGAVDFVLLEVRSRIALAQRLGVQPLTVTERAEALLAKACNGWRRNHVCQDRSRGELLRPHPACIWAQYQHDSLLLDHGLLPTEEHESIAELATIRIPLALVNRVVATLATDAANGVSMSSDFDPGQTFEDMYTWLRQSHRAIAQQLLRSFVDELEQRGIESDHPSLAYIVQGLEAEA